MSSRGILVASVVFALMLFACGSKEKPPGEWDTFTFADDGFSVYAPVKCATTNETIPTAFGPAPTRQYMCNDLSDKGALIIMVSDVELPDGLDAAKILADVADATSGGGSGKQLSSEPTTLDGVPGHEYKVRREAPELGMLELIGAAYLSGKRLYQVMGTYPVGDEKYQKKVDAFQSSFRFGSEPATE
jgi:hypothetical protein